MIRAEPWGGDEIGGKWLPVFRIPRGVLPYSLRTGRVERDTRHGPPPQHRRSA